MKIFISGGCKNGKSYIAQQLAKAQQKDRLYYIATMIPYDSEDELRINRHVNERCGWGFETVESPVNISRIIEICDKKGSFLLDSLTALLNNEMCARTEMEFSLENIINELNILYSNVNDIVIVSDYIYSDAYIYDGLTEGYRKNLAALDRFTASKCDIVLECAYSNLTVHKGGCLYESLIREKGFINGCN
ncbi:MAG: bifunctional adenosylcobinamide kinase/adenosylcobinamide-phosphate guanylyltransferase [Clostridiales bacterium]|jgi:adenosylcobinamide kinase/adenosylcobinamide-phosphate guanylyltransferase|nr:bifunctional adenosylcobinamide kinase/adenosylcobinamide-phosphate guanylyltransferase [Clostridiales bacterium]